MRNHENRVLYCAILAALAATPAAAVRAQIQAQATESGLEEIVVTARKREEALIDVPVAISAFTAQEIESAGITRPQDFIALTPNMTMVQTQNQGTSFIVVRGISQARNSEPSVARTHRRRRHGEPVAIQPGALRHPEHRGAEGAAGRPVRPQRDRRRDHHQHGRTEQDRHRRQRDRRLRFGPGYKVRAGVGGPISDTLRFQVSGSYFDTDGYTDNTYLKEKADPFKDASGRARCIWEPERPVQGGPSGLLCRTSIPRRSISTSPKASTTRASTCA